MTLTPLLTRSMGASLLLALCGVAQAQSEFTYSGVADFSYGRFEPSGLYRDLRFNSNSLTASFISGTTLRVDGARPQVRMGWPQRPPGATAAAHPAVRPFDGFHRAQVPQVFTPSYPPKTEAA